MELKGKLRNAKSEEEQVEDEERDFRRKEMAFDHDQRELGEENEHL